MMIHLPSLCLLKIFSFIDSIKLIQLRLISVHVRDFIDENIHIIQKNDIMVLTFALNKTIFNQSDDISSKNLLRLTNKLILPHIQCQFFVDHLNDIMFLGFVSTINRQKILYHTLPILKQDFQPFADGKFYFLHLREINKFAFVLFFKSVQLCVRLDIEVQRWCQIDLKSRWVNTTFGLDSFSTLFHNFKPLLFENYTERLMFQDHYKFIHWSPSNSYVLKSFDFNGNLLYESNELKIEDNFTSFRNYISVCPWTLVVSDNYSSVSSIYDFKNKMEYVLQHLTIKTCVYCSDSILFIMDEKYFYLVKFENLRMYQSVHELKSVEETQFHLYNDRLFVVDIDGFKFIDFDTIKGELIDWYDQISCSNIN
jgi:hypothetical protein